MTVERLSAAHATDTFTCGNGAGANRTTSTRDPWAAWLIGA